MAVLATETAKQLSVKSLLTGRKHQQTFRAGREGSRLQAAHKLVTKASGKMLVKVLGSIGAGYV